ncbi:unnamed protein product [Vicia faba]|uniref:Uncharacterized protein n=1 Tax=Vicia faba TaxID=3906 RepID=A0AAV0ZH79_VICFA|nr:unnamed protein product [Vicia faba]
MVNDYVPNIQVLRQVGIPQRYISFVQVVNSVKEMEFDPLKSNFVLALQVIGKMNMKSWESKKKVMKTMKFLVNDVGLTLEDIARSLGILNRNLEKTHVPRYAVVKISKLRGLIKSGLRISSFITITERMFLKRYVTPFQKDLSLLLDLYKDQKLD